MTNINKIFISALVIIIIILVGFIFFLLGKQSASNQVMTNENIDLTEVKSESSNDNNVPDVDIQDEVDNVEKNNNNTQEPTTNNTDDQVAEVECTTNSDCSDGQYCNKDTATQGCRGVGTCVAKPELCPQVVNYVCGCDGETYTNSCFSSGAGVNILSEGKCGNDEKFPSLDIKL